MAFILFYFIFSNNIQKCYGHIFLTITFIIIGEKVVNSLVLVVSTTQSTILRILKFVMKNIMYISFMRSWELQPLGIWEKSAYIYIYIYIIIIMIIEIYFDPYVWFHFHIFHEGLFFVNILIVLYWLCCPNLLLINMMVKFTTVFH